MTFSEMMTLWNSKDDFIFAVNSFTDEFKQAGRQTKIALIKNEPKFSHRAAAVEKVEVAALVEDLCLMYHLSVPSWCGKAEYFLNEPRYAWNAEKEDHRELLRSITPAHFKKRGLYYPDNAFFRV